MATPIVLLDAVDADTDGTESVLPLSTHRAGNLDHLYNVEVFADDFGGGTVRIEITQDTTNDANTQWFTARTPNDNQAIFTVADHMIIRVKANLIRAILTGSTSPSNVTARLV